MGGLAQAVAELVLGDLDQRARSRRGTMRSTLPFAAVAWQAMIDLPSFDP